MWVKKGQNSWNFLPGSIQPFPVLSACGSRCGSSTILEAFSDKAKPPQITVLRGLRLGVANVFGAAIQIRTGDLILTKHSEQVHPCTKTRIKPSFFGSPGTGGNGDFQPPGSQKVVRCRDTLSTILPGGAKWYLTFT